MTDADLATRLDAIESRTACERLINEYARGFDAHDLDMVMGIWHDGAKLLLGDVLGNHSGLEAIKTHTLKSWVDNPHMHHWMSNAIIDVDGDEATATSTLDCFVQNVESGPTQVAGTYFDTFERRAGTWGIVVRRFDLDYWTPISRWKPLAGRELGTTADSS